ncbi:hypothetical protein SLV14_002759 [Streptomyces sp. Je 1-4]|uniref:hypothetical protein n=1 Tax=Streptomyces TaxID=1883 RepID=UPI0021DB285E|nr:MULTISPECIES: hypothetical protein [unclassified Streptomyces]UYB40169.1 hypothetical protein SLV14_002759 [Streptomyces sp. Je 1-4]UZQ36260.1 hypothetical protein SLV14N_002759 [Streptomyces sp. Je 1-4] [Streptomyces sp. Je 1-4 4N24]UZQ43678.1 hypothetical protein SLV14NA_002759 [Streptomyces sp. Je 1-4] [Streptomyces sp. Je 1-4 4N24_ara]
MNDDVRIGLGLGLGLGLQSGVLEVRLEGDLDVLGLVGEVDDERLALLLPTEDSNRRSASQVREA